MIVCLRPTQYFLNSLCTNLFIDSTNFFINAVQTSKKYEAQITTNKNFPLICLQHGLTYNAKTR